jgi:hypothetical protein
MFAPETGTLADHWLTGPKGVSPVVQSRQPAMFIRHSDHTPYDD